MTAVPWFDVKPPLTTGGELCQDVDTMSCGPSGNCKLLFKCSGLTAGTSLQCVVPENIHTSPTEGIFLTPPHPSGNSS